MTSAQLRQSFLDFFREKQHTIVPSSSLLPDSPNLLFTNAGMNQFVPIFLGERTADVSRWAGAVPANDTRAADTQKCIRAGGKHNDLEDVGLDTYHHTFFEMLGNWSFGDYFKREAIDWAWELIVVRWRFPAERLYATVYQPGPGDPSERDQEAWDFWAEKFRAAGLDPAVHIVDGNKKDNFWMMGDTGPCGPCSELHVDLTPSGDTRGALVNKGTAECIEIWNLVFIQFNANADGSYSPLPARHVDTGMGFERVVSIVQCTKGFQEFSGSRISNYETDVFRPLFDEIERLSGERYTSTLPVSGSTGHTRQEKVDVAFRVIADHIRTLSFAIADGVNPGNTDRSYVIRRILRRAVRYGRTLGLHEPFLHRLVEVLAEQMGGVFPELGKRRKHVEEVVHREEEAFNRTLDKGIALFEAEAANARSREGTPRFQRASVGFQPTETRYSKRRLPHYERPWGIYHVTFSTSSGRQLTPAARDIVLSAILHFHTLRHEIFSACVMPDHVHLLIQPWVKEQSSGGEPVFWKLRELLHSIKSFSSNEINKIEGSQNPVWLEESFDRLMRNDEEAQEKFLYVVDSPWNAGIAQNEEAYPWLWTAGSDLHKQGAGENTLEACGPNPTISAAFAFRLYDEQGFPLDLTELMARERGLSVDTAGFEILMAEQRAKARAALKKTVIELSQLETRTPTTFIGFDQLETTATVQEVVEIKGATGVVLDASPCYAEMGGQVGDTGELLVGGELWTITDTRKVGHTWLHTIEGGDEPPIGATATITVDRERRRAIERHHSVTHLLHWALHEVVSTEATQKGSHVAPQKLTFDFNANALTPTQLADIERLVNARIIENTPVSWVEMPYAEVRQRPEIMQFFGDKYGDTVRVVQIGGEVGGLNGFSMELCGGTHTRATGEIGMFRIVSESAIAAGVRRIEATAGMESWTLATHDQHRLKAIAEAFSCPLNEIEHKLEASLAHQRELEKSLKSLRQREASSRAKSLVASAESINGIPAILVVLPDTDGDQIQEMAEALKATFDGVVLLIGCHADTLALVAASGPSHQKQKSAGKLIQTVAPIVGGKGGGRPELARGAGRDVTKTGAVIAAAREWLQGG